MVLLYATGHQRFVLGHAPSATAKAAQVGPAQHLLGRRVVDGQFKDRDPVRLPVGKRGNNPFFAIRFGPPW